MTQETVVITGASKGIGQAILQKLGAQGHKVIGTGRGESFDIPISETEPTLLRLDVCDEASVAAFAKKLNAENCIPDVLILNAGFGISGPIEETATEDVMAQFNTNVFGVHRLVRAFLPLMRARGHGKIIIVGSMLGRVPLPFQGFYTASKAAIAAYADALRMEVRRFNIDIVLVEPGDHKSDFDKGRIDASGAVESAYEPFASHALNIMRENEENGAPASKVADIISLIMNTSRPRGRYLRILPHERLFLVLKRILPNAMFESLVLRWLKQPR